ncbi:MAG: hypothetical protein ACRD4E_12520 [Bryobacteraceae bacterium]
MLQFYADMFVEALWGIYKIEGQWFKEGKAGATNIPFPAAVGAKALELQLQCQEHGLISTAQKCARIMEQCDGSHAVTYQEGIALMKDLRERLEDDLRGRMFLNLTPKEADLYNKPKDGWEDILSRFRGATGDVEEMRKCLALSRYPACVFHSMQVIEHGLIHLGEWLAVADHKPGWNATTRELSRIVSCPHPKRTAWEQKHFTFIEQMDAVSHSLMSAWRHKIDHAAGRLVLLPGDFSLEIVEDIVSASRNCMRRLATELPSDKRT